MSQSPPTSPPPTEGHLSPESGQEADSEADSEAAPSVQAPAPPPVSAKGRRKIPIEYIEDKYRRTVTFSKRKAGIMKKAFEIATLTGGQVLLVLASEGGNVHSFSTDKFDVITKEEGGMRLLSSCLSDSLSASQKARNALLSRLSETPSQAQMLKVGAIAAAEIAKRAKRAAEASSVFPPVPALATEPLSESISEPW